ncbi:hypothetical protein ACN47E_006342 [Coniothyrium glycines]
MASNRVVLILGAGPRVGASLADAFSRGGYKVALASRSGKPSSEGHLSLSADFTKPESIPEIFTSVRSHFKIAPSVVIYNAASATPPPDEASVLSIPAESVASDLNVNTVSPYVAAQQAIIGWNTLPSDLKKTFIYTGNILNITVIPIPIFLNLGVGKAASAYWIGSADTMYADKGFRFFYADERFPDGRSKAQELDGPAHGKFYSQLAEHNGEVPWHATFVKDQGYVKF